MVESTERPHRPTPTTTAHGPHAVIAGTGRAGTTFLMEFLRRAGVPGPDLDRLHYADEARAGFETALLDAGTDYLVKDPWLSDYLHELDHEGISIDTLIVPVRDLRTAAASRVRRQVRERARTRQHAGWENDGIVSGGFVFPLSVDDQERVLAVGQARLIAWALERDIPLHLLHYPRLVEDASYTIDTLWPWLQRFCDRPKAMAAFAESVRPDTETAVCADGDAELIRLREEVLALERERRRLRSELKARSLRGRAARVARAVHVDALAHRLIGRHRR